MCLTKCLEKGYPNLIANFLIAFIYKYIRENNFLVDRVYWGCFVLTNCFEPEVYTRLDHFILILNQIHLILYCTAFCLLLLFFFKKMKNQTIQTTTDETQFKITKRFLINYINLLNEYTHKDLQYCFWHSFTLFVSKICDSLYKVLIQDLRKSEMHVDRVTLIVLENIFPERKNPEKKSGKFKSELHFRICGCDRKQRAMSNLNAFSTNK